MIGAMTDEPPVVVNIDSIEPIERLLGERDEVCVYPDSGKVLVRSLEQLGYLEPAER